MKSINYGSCWRGEKGKWWSLAGKIIGCFVFNYWVDSAYVQQNTMQRCAFTIGKKRNGGKRETTSNTDKNEIGNKG